MSDRKQPTRPARQPTGAAGQPTGPAAPPAAPTPPAGSTQPPSGTPEGQTAEAPAPSEIGKLGTPGGAMTPAVPHPADAERVEHGEPPADSVDAVAHHDAATHMDAHTAVSDDDHGHAEPRLGPIDWVAWGYAGLGVLAGVLVAALFLVAVARPPAS